MNSEEQKNNTTKAASHEDFAELGHPSLFFLGLKRKIEKYLNTSFQKKISFPLQNKLLSHWENGDIISKLVEKIGLPRHGVESSFPDQLNFKVNPHVLDRIVAQRNPSNGRKLTNFFIWDGDWDKQYADFKTCDRYLFISDIWNNKDDLTRSLTYKKYLQLLTDGTPYLSVNKNHSGVLLNSSDKIRRYLEIYLSFMLSMQEHGYDSSVTNDPVGVAIDRDGKLVKINKGLHRLAMAQILNMEYIEVRLRAVHRCWWNKVTDHISDSGDKFNKVTEDLRNKNLLF